MRTKKEMIDEAMGLLQKLSEFNCDRLDCPDCPFTTMEDGSPHPSGWCYSNQATDQLGWLNAENHGCKESAKT